ncbi:putative uncharacterized protein (fragment), partial [Rhodococcus sp. AW25M09]
MNGQDIRDLLSMKSSAAYAVAGFYILACVVCASATLDGVSAVWPPFVAVLVFAGAVMLLLGAPGDPLSPRVTALLTASGPVAAALDFAVLPVPVSGALQTWPLGMSVVIYTFMCVRGRTLAAWLGLALSLSVAIGWAVLTDQGALYGLSS